MEPVRNILGLVIWALMMTIFASVIISWLRQFRVRIPEYNPVVRAVEETAELMLGPIRRAIPTTGGGFDFSPVIAFMILYILQKLIGRL